MAVSKFDVMDMINASATLQDGRTIAAHFILALEAETSRQDEVMTDLEKDMVKAANAHLKTVPRDVVERTDKQARFMMMDDKAKLDRIDKARCGGHEIPEYALEAERKILSRSG